MSPGSPRWFSARLAGAAASAALLGVTVVILGAVTPDYDYRADTVSRLGSPGQPYAVIARAGFALYGLLVVAGAQPLGRRVQERARLLAGALTVYGAAAVVAGVASKDRPGASHTVMSQVHVDATVAGGVGIFVAMALVSVRSPLPVERRASTIVALLTAAGAVLFRCSWGSQVYGLVERGLLMLAALWVVALALRALSDERAKWGLAGADELGKALPTTGTTID